MIKIIKKDGSLQEFTPEKIEIAVSKSAERACVSLTDEDMKLIVLNVRDVLEKKNNDIKVSELHNIVENAVEEVNKNVANSYREYRNYKKDFSTILDRVYNKKLSLNNADDRGNANADSSLVTTQKAIVYNELNSMLYEKFFLNEEERKAVQEGYIYIHDKGSRLDTTNCFVRDTRFITKNGIKSFNDFQEGDSVIVLTHKGNWKQAKVIKLPCNGLQRVFVKKGDAKDLWFDCTPNHRWLLKDGSVTTSLKIGDELIDTPDKEIRRFYLSDLFKNYSEDKKQSNIVISNMFSKNKNWHVTNIESLETNNIEYVWCLAVEDDHSFILEGGVPTGNCCLLDVKTILRDGFTMGNLDYTEPKSLRVAFDVVCDIMLNAGSSQYGGLTVSQFDKLMAPYAELSYNYYKNDFKQTVESVGGEYNEEKADEYAFKKVKKDMEAGVQSIEYRMNSLGSARGDYVFTAITFGLGTSRWETLFSSVCMNVRKNGQGKPGLKHPVLFPKLSFFYDENLHGEGKPLEWLFDEAIDCSSKSMYPDFISLTGDGYAPSIYKKYGVPISRMGCVDGSHKITFRKKNTDEEKTVSFVDFWKEMADTYHANYGSTDGWHSDFIDLKDIEILDVSDFVNCSRVIRNPDIKDWCEITLRNGDVIKCTSDHYWSTRYNGLKKTLDLTEDDDVPIVISGKKSFTRVDKIQFIGKRDGDSSAKYSYDVTTESHHFNCDNLRSHNCRAHLSPWFERGGRTPADDKDIPRYEGRINLGAISLHFPMIVAKSKEENKDFWEVLTYYLDLIRGIHKKTFKYLSHKKAGLNPLGFCQGGFLNGFRKPDEEIGEDLLRPMTMSFGVIALNEASIVMNGKSISEDNSFAIEILKYINDYIAKYKEIDNILYAIYGVPGEELVIKQVKQFREKYGIVKDVSDHEYTTNSFHCCVRDQITPIEKQDIEYPMFHLCTGGNIQYCRYPLQYNLEAIKTLVRRAMDMGFYEGVNISLDFCSNCGCSFNDADVCPKCGSDDLVRIERMNGYLGYAKIRGRSLYSDGKLKEFDERVSM